MKYTFHLSYTVRFFFSLLKSHIQHYCIHVWHYCSGILVINLACKENAWACTCLFVEDEYTQLISHDEMFWNNWEKRECHPSVLGFTGPVKQKCIKVMIGYTFASIFCSRFFLCFWLSDWYQNGYKKAFIEFRHYTNTNTIIFIMYTLFICLVLWYASRINCVQYTKQIFLFISRTFHTRKEPRFFLLMEKNGNTSDDAFYAPKYIILCSKIVFYYSTTPFR